MPPAGYFQQVQSILHKYDILLWDDEVICGFGRTGNDFGATTFDFKPDLMSFAIRVRERGWQGLCQVLKSFRDSDVEFPQYEVGTKNHLDELGSLSIPHSYEVFS